MDIEQAIRERRSNGAVKSDPVDRAIIEKLLEAAVWAPNHHCTEPWRFYVMTGDGRAVLGNAYKHIASGLMVAPDSELSMLATQKHYDKAFRAPVVIAVAAIPSDSMKAAKIEELAAVHAAVQNMLLEAHALGLGTVWRTGEPAYHPHMKQAFGLSAETEMVDFIYIGYPAKLAPARVQPAFLDKTVWLNN